jgi:hypothetical protein
MSSHRSEAAADIVGNFLVGGSGELEIDSDAVHDTGDVGFWGIMGFDCRRIETEVGGGCEVAKDLLFMVGLCHSVLQGSELEIEGISPEDLPLMPTKVVGAWALLSSLGRSNRHAMEPVEAIAA